MSQKDPRKRLGRGLAALIGEEKFHARPALVPVPEGEEAGLLDVPIDAIELNPYNPRRNFEEEELENLKDSIHLHGILQPLVVRLSQTPGKYQLIAGERRLRAAKRAGLTKIPVVLRKVDDVKALEIAIIENVQRADLNALEEAQGYENLLEQYGYTQQSLSTRLGKSRSYIANSLRLLKLPFSVQKLLAEGKISAGHARCLINTPDAEALAEEIVRKGLSVRQTEQHIQNYKNFAATPKQETKANAQAARKDADIVALEQLLQNMTGMRVEIKHKALGCGSLILHYDSFEGLKDLCTRLRT